MFNYITLYIFLTSRVKLYLFDFMFNLYMQKGRANNICSRAPCFNKGICTQINPSPGYKCTCNGTGYYGPRCQRKCPQGFEAPNERGEKFPNECIVI